MKHRELLRRAFYKKRNIRISGSLVLNLNLSVDALGDSQAVLCSLVLELLVISVTAVYVMQVYYKQRDYWPFVWCVRYISPHLASHVEQVCSNRLIRLYLNMGATAASTCTFY